MKNTTAKYAVGETVARAQTVGCDGRIVLLEKITGVAVKDNASIYQVKNDSLWYQEESLYPLSTPLLYETVIKGEDQC